MQLSSIFRGLVDNNTINSHEGFMVFAGTMAGTSGKNGMPVKVAGICCQEYNHEYIIEDVNLEMLTCVAVVVDDLEDVTTIPELIKVVNKENSEDARRVISTLETLEDTGFKLYRYDESDALTLNLGVMIPKSAEVQFPDSMELAKVNGLDDLCFDMGVCRSVI